MSPDDGIEAAAVWRLEGAVPALLFVLGKLEASGFAVEATAVTWKIAATLTKVPLKIPIDWSSFDETIQSVYQVVKVLFLEMHRQNFLGHPDDAYQRARELAVAATLLAEVSRWNREDQDRRFAASVSEGLSVL